MTNTKSATDDRPLLHRALSEIAGHDELAAAIDRLDQHAKTLSADSDASPEALRDMVRQAVVSGDPVPDDLGQRLVDAEQRQRATILEAELIGRRFGRQGAGLLGELVNEQRQLVKDQSDAAFRVLAAELDDVLEAVATVDQTLGPVATMEAALRTSDDHAQAWRQLLALVDVYDELRQAQHELTALALADGEAQHTASRLLEDAGYLRNAEAIDPTWRHRQTAPPKWQPGDPAQAPTGPSTDQLLAESPWPAPTLTRGAGPWPTDDRPAYLRWLTTAVPQPWLPTLAELHAKHADLTKPRPRNTMPEPSKRDQKRLERMRSAAASEAAAEEDRQRIKAGRD